MLVVLACISGQLAECIAVARRGVSPYIAACSQVFAWQADAYSRAGLDQVLVADFFFILVALAWLGFGVAAESTGATSVGAHLARLPAILRTSCS